MWEKFIMAGTKKPPAEKKPNRPKPSATEDLPVISLKTMLVEMQGSLSSIYTVMGENNARTTYQNNSIGEIKLSLEKVRLDNEKEYLALRNANHGTSVLVNQLATQINELMTRYKEGNVTENLKINKSEIDTLKIDTKILKEHVGKSEFRFFILWGVFVLSLVLGVYALAHGGVI